MRPFKVKYVSYLDDGAGAAFADSGALMVADGMCYWIVSGGRARRHCLSPSLSIKAVSSRGNSFCIAAHDASSGKGAVFEVSKSGEVLSSISVPLPMPSACALTQFGPVVCEGGVCVLFDWSGEGLWTLDAWPVPSVHVDPVNGSVLYLANLIVSVKSGEVLKVIRKRGNPRVVSVCERFVALLSEEGEHMRLQLLPRSNVWRKAVWTQEFARRPGPTALAPDCSVLIAAFSENSFVHSFDDDASWLVDFPEAVQSVAVSRNRDVAVATEGYLFIGELYE